MPGPPSALKKARHCRGFQRIYRTSPDSESRSADRVRDNLLMDSGVSVVDGESLAVRVVMRAQSLEFPRREPAEARPSPGRARSKQ